MSNVLDVSVFIGEIYKRPALWCVRGENYKDRRHLQAQLWKEVSEIVNIDVDQCKRKWKNLRDTYRAEVKRTERRIERDKLSGSYTNDNNYKSKWTYFDAMSFLQFSNQRSFEDDSNSADTTLNHFYNDTEEENVPNISKIKSEPEHSDDDEEANDLPFEEFKNIAILEHIGDSDYNFLVSFLPQIKKMNESQNLQFRAKMCEIVINILALSMTVETPAIAASVYPPAIGLVTDDAINAAATSTSPSNLL